MTRNLQEIRAQMKRLVEDASINMIESNTIKVYVVYFEIGNKVYYIYDNMATYMFDKTSNILNATFFETEEMAREAFDIMALEVDLIDDNGNVLDNMLKIKEVTITY